jgi:hypothetical protein
VLRDPLGPRHPAIMALELQVGTPTFLGFVPSTNLAHFGQHSDLRFTERFHIHIKGGSLVNERRKIVHERYALAEQYVRHKDKHDQ